MGLRDLDQAAATFLPDEQSVPDDQSVQSPTVFTDQGQIPEVAPDVEPGKTASQLAFGEEEAGADKVELTATQVADAKRYYTSQPWKYTKQVITDIQNKVGATPTGRIDDDTVQKVATFQAEINDSRTPNPPLAVDGKAGPRTLPILIPVGLATDDQINAFAEEVKGEEDELEKQSIEDRANTLLEDVNNRLKDVEVPKIKAPVILDDALNAFDPATWQMTMSRKTLAKPKDAAATMYHEARHAEQSFRIARMLAGEGRGADAIKAETKITDDDIVAAAMEEKLDPGTVEAVQAKGWHENEPGRPTQAQQDARMKTSAERFKAAALAFKANPTDENKQKAADAYDEFKAAQAEAYRNRPNEYDAFFVGDKVSDELGVKRDGEFPPLDEAIDIVVNA